MKPSTRSIGSIVSVAGLAIACCLLLIAESASAQLSTNSFPPLPHGKAADGTVRFVVMGDTGTGKEAQLAIAERMTGFFDERPYDTVLMLGDNIYSGGKSSDLAKKFEQPYAKLLKGDVKFYASLGNHDVSKGRALQLNYPNFHMGGKAYYSVAKADDLIEFFAIDSTSFDFEQQRWLEGALTSSKARWKIPFFHHPIYSSGKAHGSDTRLRAKLEPIFIKFGVKAVLSGHDHFYERTKPQQGIQYFVCGASGQLRRGNINRRSPFFETGNDQATSFLFAEASKNSLTFWAIDATGKTLDGITLKASEHPQ